MLAPLFSLFMAISIIRVILQVLSDRNKVPKAVLGTVTIIHLALAAVLAFLIARDSQTGGTRYIANGTEITALVDNPFSKFVVLFLLFGGLFFIILWAVVALIIKFTESMHTMNIAQKLANISIWVGIIAFPVSIVLASTLRQSSWSFILSIAAITALCGIISCIISNKNKLKIYNGAIVGIILSAFYFFVLINILLRT